MTDKHTSETKAARKPVDAGKAGPRYRYATQEEVQQATEKGMKQYKNALKNLEKR